MKYLITAILLVVFIGTSYAADDDAEIVFSYSYSMRIANNQVVIYFNPDKNLLRVVEKTLEAKDVARNVSVTEQQVNRVIHLFSAIAWDKVDPDSIPGLDGYTYAVHSKNIKKSVWVPEYKSTERGLDDFRKLCSYVLEVSGLDENALSVE